MSAIRFGDAFAQRWFRTIASSVNATMEINNVVLQVSLVVMPANTIRSDCGRLLQIEESFFQQFAVDVVQLVHESERAVLAGSFTHAV